MALATENLLLGSLSSGDQELIEPCLTHVTLEYRKQLATTGQNIEAVYFPDRGLGSVVALNAGRRRQVEVAVIGLEGMTGTALLLGEPRAPHDVFMQVEGGGWRLEASSLLRLIEKSRSLATTLRSFAHVVAVQVEQTALANACANTDARLARWLLMAQDRLGDEVRLTHEYIALMLGTRRATVTMALQDLRNKQLIDHRRGSIIILDRAGLLRAARDFYGVPEAEYRRLFPETAPSRKLVEQPVR